LITLISYPLSFLSYNAPPSYGAFMSITASNNCTVPKTAVYSAEYGRTFVLVVADKNVASSTLVRLSSMCDVLNCHAGQFMSSSSVCVDCPAGSVSVEASVGPESCVSCLEDGLEPVGPKSKDCVVSRNADPTSNTGSLWRIIVPLAHTASGSIEVTELEFYSLEDCSNSSRISTKGGIPFSSGSSSTSGPEKAFNNVNGLWRGKMDSRNLFYLGMDFNKTVTVSCIIYRQPSIMAKEIRVQTKYNGEVWKNVWIQKFLQNTTIIPFAFAPTSAPTKAPTNAPTKKPSVAPLRAPFPLATPSTSLSPFLSPVSTTGNTCNRPENVCRGGLLRLFKSGQLMHRSVLGICFERCSSFLVFRGLFGFLGWKCGGCP
jgi:hypothetical protein